MTKPIAAPGGYSTSRLSVNFLFRVVDFSAKVAYVDWLICAFHFAIFLSCAATVVIFEGLG